MDRVLTIHALYCYQWVFVAYTSSREDKRLGRRPCQRTLREKNVTV